MVSSICIDALCYLAGKRWHQSWKHARQDNPRIPCTPLLCLLMNSCWYISEKFSKAVSGDTYTQRKWILICVCNIFALAWCGSIYLCDLGVKLSPKALTSMKVEPLVWIMLERKLPNDYLGNIFDVSDGVVAPFQLRSYQHREHPEHKFWEQFLSTMGTFLWHQVFKQF